MVRNIPLTYSKEDLSAEIIRKFSGKEKGKIAIEYVNFCYDLSDLGNFEKKLKKLKKDR